MRISIIIPCYNTETYLKEAIESVLCQTRPADEIIVVDDGSTDRSAELASSFGSPVRVLSQENRGLAGARTSGLKKSTGDYVLFLDADDLLDEAALEVLCDHVRDNLEAAAVMDCAMFEHDPGSPYSIHNVSVDAFFPSIIRGNIAPVHSWFVPRRLVADAGGFNSKLHIFEDWECWCRVALRGAKLLPVPYVGALYRRHPDSMMAKAIHSVTDNVLMGHIHVLRTLCAGLLGRADLLEQYGEMLFWSTWTGVHRARKRGIACAELNALVKDLESMAAIGPASVTKSRFAFLIRLLGFRTADMLRSRFSMSREIKKKAKPDHQKPSWLRVESASE